MSLAYTPRITRSTWEPVRPTKVHRSTPAHRDAERAQPVIPTSAIASTTAIAIGFALIATNLPATIVRDVTAPAEPTTDTGQLHTITASQPQIEVAQVHDEWLAKNAAQAFRATPVRTELTPAKVAPARVTQKAVTTKVTAPAARPAVKATSAAKAVITKIAPAKAAKSAPKKAAAKKSVRHKQSVHHKAASITTGAYFSQFNRAGAAERKHNAALIIEIGKKRGFSSRSIMVAVGTAIQESGLRNLNYGDRDSYGLFQQRPSMGWGSLRQITTPKYAINKFYDSLARVHGRDSMSMMHAAMKVQIPDPYYYGRDWKWDSVATQIVHSYKA